MGCRQCWSMRRTSAMCGCWPRCYRRGDWGTWGGGFHSSGGEWINDPGILHDITGLYYAIWSHIATGCNWMGFSDGLRKSARPPGTRPRRRPAGHHRGRDRGAGAAADLPPERTTGAAAAAAAAAADPAAEPHCGAAGDAASKPPRVLTRFNLFG